MCLYFSLIWPILGKKITVFLEELRTPQFPSEISWPLVGGHLDFWIWYTHWMEKFLQNFGTSTNTCLIWCKGDFISENIFKLVQSSINKIPICIPILPLLNDGGTGGATAPSPAIFGRSVNPISSRGDRLCQPNYYWHTWIFRPYDGPLYYKWFNEI